MATTQNIPTDARLTEVASKAASQVASTAANSIRGLVDEGRTMATEQLDATARWVDETTRAHPLRTLGIAALIGLVVGLIVGRR